MAIKKTVSETTNSVSLLLGGKLSVLEKVGYGLGDTASNILYQAWSFFLPFFYTNVFGISAKNATIMFLVARLWDMFTDPMMGMIADRTNTRWGKFRPYLLWMAVPFGVLVWALFITPDWGQNLKIVYAYVSYILATMAYTAVNIPYSSMMAVMTPNPRERATLSQYRFFLAFVGMLLITTFMEPLAKFFGSDPSHSGYDPKIGYSQALGYQVAMGIFGGIAVILLFITFLTTRERVRGLKQQENIFKDDMKDISKNYPWIILVIVVFFWLIHNVLRNGIIKYFFDYVNGEGHKILMTWNIGSLVLDFDQTTTFMTLITIGMIIGVLLSTPLKKYFERKVVIIYLSIASVFANLVFYWISPDNFILLCIANIFWSIIAGSMPVFLFAMFADVADFHEWKFMKRATGLVTAGIMFSLKLGVAIGGALLMYILGLYDFSDSVSITPKIQNGIKLIFSIIPAGFILISGIALFFYPLNDKLLEEIEMDLNERKQNADLS